MNNNKLNVKTAKRLFGYIAGQNKIQFALVLICIFLSTMANVAGSLFLQILIDNYIEPLLLEAAPVFDGLVRAILTMAFIYAAGVVSTFFYNWLMAGISQGVQKRIRDKMFAHMQTLPVRYFDTHTFGDVMSHYTNDIDTLRQMVSQSFPQLLSSCMTIVMVFCAMLYTSIYLTLFILMTITCLILVSKKVAGKSASFFIRQQKSLGDVNGYIEEMVSGQKVIKVFCHEDEAKEEFDKKNDELCRNASSANTFANILAPITMNLGNLQYVLLAVFGGLLAVNGIGGLTLGAIASFLQLSRSFTMPINQMSMQINAIIMALAGAERIFRLIDEEPESDDGYVTLVRIRVKESAPEEYRRVREAGTGGGDELPEQIPAEFVEETVERSGIWAWKHPHETGEVTYTRLTGDVRFFDVDFGYEENKIVLHNVSLYAKPGQKIAFVGATGAGKTTITNLINRFYDIDDGKIRYDNININKIRKTDLRRSLGIVLQDTNLFTGTVMENIRYGRLDASDEEVRRAAKLANADGFIERLPDGYDTMITGNGANLSQGQRQLLSIARAAVADPPVMILDEATSSIDTRTESIVQRGMDSLMKGRTVFVIAHRLSTVKNSNAILVLEHGRVIERGSHEQLIEERGKYYQLYTGAFELE
ncbi:ABC transporter ATP-binding protein/permease [Lacrimispora sp. NSJ-141]|uniref:ABC transporter ATP-binding protein/permease n=1 Tax=Lientehia hominis TaxID=2897778 RepID=A0AAP2RLR3_9FIRM|nr:ABC transporter ATP-binding protein [Lientehia hominis]MCD2493575.1 ABC transporter ATP-binding protein/permease [Lientehia hominis]